MGHAKPITYTDWYRMGTVSEPSNGSGDEDCIELRHSERFTWNDIPCHHQKFALCEEKISKQFGLFANGFDSRFDFYEKRLFLGQLPGSQSLHDSLNTRIKLD